MRLDGPIFIKNAKNLRVENVTSRLDEEFPEKLLKIRMMAANMYFQLCQTQLENELQEMKAG